MSSDCDRSHVNDVVSILVVPHQNMMERPEMSMRQSTLGAPSMFWEIGYLIFTTSPSSRCAALVPMDHEVSGTK